MRVFRRVMLGEGIDIDAIPDTQKIYYTATAKVEPKSNSLGAAVIANKWDSTTNEGIIVCSRDITMIYDDAFRSVSALTSVTIPDSVTEIRGSAFLNCYSLTSIIVSEGNSVYDSRENCNAIITTATNELEIGCSSTIIPNSVTSIGGGAFQNCYSLTSITIPDSVTEIGDYAFNGCTSLTNIIISNSVTLIRPATFSKCSSLTSVTIPNRVTVIDNAAFADCSSLKSIIIPESVRNIRGMVFKGCTSLININISKNITDIGSAAFYNCSGRLTIDSKIIEINYQYNNNPISTGWLSGSKFTELILSNNIEKIGNCAFYYYKSLTSITIPDSVTSIGVAAFYGCTSIQYYDFSIHESVPTLNNTDAFYNIPSTCKIIVPDALYNEWIAATNWSTYASHIIKKSDWDASQTTE